MTVACDGKSTLHRCFKPWNSNPLAKHFDLIQATWATITGTTLKWSWEHIQGHQDDHDQPLTITEQQNVDMDREAKAHWTEHHTNRQSRQVQFHGKTWRIFLGTKKISTNLKYHLLDHMAGQVVHDYWAGKTRFWGLDINLVDWDTIEKVVSSQTITMCCWTTKFSTGFCATGCCMVQMKLRQTADCPCCGHRNEDTSHILQCPHPDAQLLWDTAILQLRGHLYNAETKPGTMEDLSTGIDAWCKQEPPPHTLTTAGQAQTSLTWNNLVHGFLGKEWKIQQATYYNQWRSMASANKWAADVL